MASSESTGVDESFRARVDKVFGSLASSKSLPAWSLTDEEVERREWRRDTDTSERDETPCSSSFDGFSPKDRKRRDRREDFGDDGGGDERDGVDEWEIRSSIGLDPTLDREEEEDEFDKVALGRENAGDRLYMSDVTDHGSYLNSHNVLPKAKDPRANHLAAKVRLREDEDEAKKGNPSEANATETNEPLVKASEDGCQPRSILKRKDSDTLSKSRKRVRFNPDCKEDDGSSEPEVVLQNESAVAQNTRKVPDYILNPSKYKHYTFDSSTDVDEESNTEAFKDFLEHIQRSKPADSLTEPECASVELPKSVTFIPKKKRNDANAEAKEDHDMLSVNRTSRPVGIAVGEVEEDETSAMDEDVPEAIAAEKVDRLQKSGRRYRNAPRSDDSDA